MNEIRITPFALFAAMGLGLASSSSALTLTPSPAPKPNTTSTKTAGDSVSDTWMLGLGIGERSLKSSDDNSVSGNAGTVAIGKAYLAEHWFAGGAFEFLMGPYRPIRNGQLDADSSGMGFSLWTGRTVRGQNLRSQPYSWGWTMSASWAELNTNSIGKNRVETSDPAQDSRQALLDNYTMQSTLISAGGGLFFAILQPAPETGNTPSDLATRVEGVILRAGVSLPLYSHYKATYDIRRVESASRATTPTYLTEPRDERGSFTGYSVLISVDTLLGG